METVERSAVGEVRLEEGPNRRSTEDFQGTNVMHLSKPIERAIARV